MAAPVLSLRALNRATLERQSLLERRPMPALHAVHALVGLQAQVPLNPYTALWSRLDGFGPGELAGLLVGRQVVRIVVMRATIHLVTTEDCLLLRPLMQPILDKELSRHPEYGPALRSLVLDPVLAYGREVLNQSRTLPELRRLLGERFPDHDPAALAYACRCLLALVQVPPRGVWGRAGQVTVTTAEAWLGRSLVKRPSIEDVIVRYLRAFGPASVADAGTWSRLTGLREVFERLRPRLRTFRDERGRELFDVPDGPLPDPDTPTSPRFLPEFDNVLLSHADRTRFLPDDRRQFLLTRASSLRGTVMWDGAVGAAWSIDRDGDTGGATLAVRYVEKPRDASAAAIVDEGLALLRFLEPEATTHDVRFVPLTGEEAGR